ncbi:MAG: single-stranded DNA-binding protein [Clostridia bacterium]|nr:single-stranded DNA-binding protein [Clostridia bacterium]
MNNIEKSVNVARVAGRVCSEITKSHEIEGENFFEFKVEVERLSKIKDIVPVTISERTLAGAEIKVGDFMELSGEYRSYNKLFGEKSRLILHLFAKDFEIKSGECEFMNEVALTGFICKDTVFRKTPFEREICDVLLAVNRMNNRKSDYIPCIMWGRNARFIASQGVGSKVEIVGRIQSREYSKTLEDGTVENKTAYEVSCQKVAILENVVAIEPGKRKSDDREILA